MALAGCCCLLGACGAEKAPPPAPQTVPVVVTMPARHPVRDVLEFDGVVEASASVNLVARVPGFLQEVRFRDGDPVRAGQVLFVIEPDAYREQVKLNQARLDQTQAEARRQRTLLAENATSQASVENAQSQLQQAQANLRLAELNLRYTEVRAPFDGVVGRRLVDVGNYVGAGPGGTVLATVLKLRPAFVNFSIGERDLLRLRARVPGEGATGRRSLGRLPIGAALQGETQPSEHGLLDFIDTNLAASTGSIQMRARFANAHLHLVPGLYAKVSFALGDARLALLLPAAAMQSDQQGSYVFVVDPGQTARRRNVHTGAAFGSLREVRSGLQAEDRVVVKGLANIADGQSVAPEPLPAAEWPPLPAIPPTPAAVRH